MWHCVVYMLLFSSFLYQGRSGACNRPTTSLGVLLTICFSKEPRSQDTDLPEAGGVSTSKKQEGKDERGRRKKNDGRGREMV